MRLRSPLRLMTIAAVILTACGGGSSTEPPGDGNTVQVQAFDRQDYNADGF